METPGPVPVGEPRYVHFLEGTTLLPGKWDGPIQVMAIEHKPDNMTVFIRPYLPDYDSPEELRQVPTQKMKPGQGDEHYIESIVFDSVVSSMLPHTLRFQELENDASFDFTMRRGDSVSIPALRAYAPAGLLQFGMDTPREAGQGLGSQDAVSVLQASLAKDLSAVLSSALEPINQRLAALEASRGLQPPSGVLPPPAIPSAGGIEELEQRLATIKMATGPGAPASSRAAPKRDGPGAFVLPVETGANIDAKTAEQTGKTTATNGTEDLSLMYRRLEYMSKSPLDLVLAHGKNLTQFEDWPFLGTAGAARVAPWYYPQVYQSGKRGTQYAEDWMRAHGLMKNKLAAQMKTLLLQVDEALLYDGINILNSAAFEVTARRCYGLEKAFELCRNENDWQNSKKEDNKVRMALLDDYDLTHILAAGTRCPPADTAAKKEMETRATFNKWLTKSSEGGSIA